MPKAAPLSEEDAWQSCAVCLDAPPTHAAVPCGHRALCSACAILCASRCPMCDLPAERYVRIYL